MALRRGSLLLAAIGVAAASAAAFEPPLTFKASEILSSQSVKGPHHTIGEEVRAPHYYQEFQITSDYGAMRAEGRTVLHTRLTEVDALERLKEVSKTEVFAKAAGGAVLNVGKSVASVVADPKGTAEGMGAGIKRFGTNLGRKAKRGADSVAHDDKKPDGPPKSAEETAGSAANSVLGVNSAARKWAQKLHVDPYTTNAVLHDALVDVGKIDKAGSIITKVVLPVPAVVSTTASVGGLVWATDPEALRKRNEATAKRLGASGDVVARFFRNGNYTLTSHTRFMEALSAVEAEGRGDYVDAAAEATSEREALFFVESAEMLAGLHKATPVTAVLQDSRALVARRGASAVALLPFDTMRWTEPLSQAAAEIAGRAKKELGATALAIHLSGKATAAAREGLTQSGWQLKERVTDGLTVLPAE
jgi:hypothetical protein